MAYTSQGGTNSNPLNSGNSNGTNGQSGVKTGTGTNSVDIFDYQAKNLIVERKPEFNQNVTSQLDNTDILAGNVSKIEEMVERELAGSEPLVKAPVSSAVRIEDR